jgi:hypothetical protein
VFSCCAECLQLALLLLAGHCQPHTGQLHLRCHIDSSAEHTRQQVSRCFGCKQLLLLLLAGPCWPASPKVTHSSGTHTAAQNTQRHEKHTAQQVSRCVGCRQLRLLLLAGHCQPHPGQLHLRWHRQQRTPYSKACKTLWCVRACRQLLLLAGHCQPHTRQLHLMSHTAAQDTQQGM